MTRSTELQKRALTAIRTSRNSTAALAAALGVSWRTAARTIATLRNRGHHIVTVREGNRWWYRLETEHGEKDTADPLFELSGFVETGLRDGSENHDHYLYGWPRVRRKRGRVPGPASGK